MQINNNCCCDHRTSGFAICLHDNIKYEYKVNELLFADTAFVPNIVPSSGQFLKFLLCIECCSLIDG